MAKHSHHPSWQASPALFPLVLFLAVLPLAHTFAAEETGFPSARELILVPHRGEGAADLTIRQAQAKVESGLIPVAALERLGWSYIAKSRESFDAGYLLLAEACATAIEAVPEAEKPSPEALLLRGHVFTQWHRFAEAELIARDLVALRGLSFDHLLLGDALMEQGKLDEAIKAYQDGVDLRPDLQSYARVGWIRWLIGDLEGAIEATARAVRAGSREDPESLAWVTTRLASFHFTAGNREAAQNGVKAALKISPSYPPALLLSARLHLAQGDAAGAVALLKPAVAANPMPDYLWLLTEALEAAGDESEGRAMEARLKKTGSAIDGRTMALFFATRGESLVEAEAMARQELTHRQDIFTHDALAFALYALGRSAEAQEQIDLALDEGTEDARLFFHAALIAASLGELEEADDWLIAATDLQDTLLPSEKRRLADLRLSLNSPVSRAAYAAAGENQPDIEKTP